MTEPIDIEKYLAEIRAARAARGETTRLVSSGTRAIVETVPIIPSTATVHTKGLSPILWTDLGSLDDRKVILLQDGALLPTLAAIEAAIMADEEAATLFQWGGVLAYLKRNPKPAKADGILRAANSLTIEIATKEWLKLRIAKSVIFQRYDQRERKLVDKDPPGNLVDSLFGAKSWHFKVLVSTIETPTLREDGTVLATTGYDAATGLFLDPGNAVFPPILDEPTREDGLAGLAKIKNVFHEFPFVQLESEQGTDRCASRSVAIAALFTALVRRSLPTAPMFVMDAPAPGSGKTLAAKVIFYIAIDRDAAVAVYTGDEQETRKSITATLSAGDPITLFDNVDLPLGGAALCAALTSTVWKDRILGVSRNVQVPVLTTFIATGNNVPIEADIVRRVVRCQIDPRCENPEERQFEQPDLLGYVREHRGELVAAALTVMRAYVVAGRPDQKMPVLGSFEEWSSMVRAPLVWLGEADPVATQKAVMIEDPQREIVLSVLRPWFRVYGKAPVTTPEVVRQITGEDKDYVQVTADMKELREALEGVIDRGKLTPRTVGKWFRKHKDRVFAGASFRNVGGGKNAVLWRVEGEPIEG
jgi:putative DNA primase/helicase